MTVAEHESPLPRSKVLIVDDNVQNLELIEAYLEELDGVTTISATDGEGCLKKVESDRPDLILLDIMMPRMSGYEVCQRLKSDPTTRDIPIVMVTALHEMGDIERGVEVGTNDFISKPVNRADLLARVKALLCVRRAGSGDSADGRG